jgi:hypothetical protein
MKRQDIHTLVLFGVVGIFVALCMGLTLARAGR